jgi:hypothetical protein
MARFEVRQTERAFPRSGEHGRGRGRIASVGRGSTRYVSLASFYPFYICRDRCGTAVISFLFAYPNLRVSMRSFSLSIVHLPRTSFSRGHVCELRAGAPHLMHPAHARTHTTRSHCATTSPGDMAHLPDQRCHLCALARRSGSRAPPYPALSSATSAYSAASASFAAAGPPVPASPCPAVSAT